MTTPAFVMPELQLPPALDLAAAVRALRRYCGRGRFARILRAVAPETWRGLGPDPDPRRAFDALYKWLGTQLPIYEDGVDTDPDFLDDPDLDGGFRIPLVAMGFSEWSFMDDNYGSPAIAAAVWVSMDKSVVVSVRAGTDQESLHSFKSQAMASARLIFDAAGVVADPSLGVNGSALRRLRDRYLKPCWHGVTDLMAWILNDTPYDILNASERDVDEGAVEFPDLTLADIKAQIRVWSEAKPIKARIDRVIKYIDARPSERAPLFMRAVAGDATAIARMRR